MKSTHPLAPRVVSVFFGLLVSCVLGPNLAGSVQACSFPPVNLINERWPQNITVQVNIDPAYDAQQRAAITNAFIHWTANMFFNCSMVKFAVPTFSSTPIAGPTIGGQLGQYKYQVYNQNSPVFPSARGHTQSGTVGAIQLTAWTYLNTAVTVPAALTQVMAHEIGHTFNLEECENCGSTASVMNGPVSNFNDTNGLDGPTILCDDAMIALQYNCFNACGHTDDTCVQNSDCCQGLTCNGGTCGESNTPALCQAAGWYWNFSNNTCNEWSQACPQHCWGYQPLESGGCWDAVDYCSYEWGCGFGTTDGGSGCCCGPTPILIDVSGNGFSLTDAYNGVHFDMGGDGRREPIAWTSSNSNNAWLCLDLNGNGQIDSAKELFGNFTDQPDPPVGVARNGFLALAQYDRAGNGGNEDDVIDHRDTVFARLKLWQDLNHNGVSEAGELRSLPDLGIHAISLKYKESKKTDSFGNAFRYRAKVMDDKGRQVGRWAWDVILQVNPAPRP